MYKKLFLVVLVMSLTLFAGCNKKHAEMATVPNDEPILGVEYSDIPLFTDGEDGKQKLTENPIEQEIKEEIDNTESDKPTEKALGTSASENKVDKETEPPATEPPTTEPPATEPPTTEPPATEPPATEPSTTEPPVTLPPVSVGTTSYEWYNSLSGAEQVNFFNTFESMEAFVNWYNSAKAEHDALHPDVEVGNGSIDLGKNGS